MPRALALLVAAAVLFAACVPGPTTGASPSPTGPAKVQVTDKTKDEIQAAIRAQRDALTKRDLKAYQATFDGQRNALRRCKTESFETAGRVGASAVTPTVVKVEPYLDTYVRAWVDEGSNGITRTYFRREEGRWIQTEPTKDEVGGEKKKTVDGLDIDYWGIDEDVVDAFAKGTLAARDKVIKEQLGESKRPFAIRFYPTREVAGIVACNVVGFHLTNTPDDPYIRFFRYWFTPSLNELSPSTISFVQHEGLHWAQDQFIVGITARLDWWLTEGWPDFIGQSRSLEYKKQVLCATRAPTFKELVDGPRDDLPETQPEDTVRYYAFANTMVEYLYAQFGPDAYKQLLVAYKDRVDPPTNYPKVLKVTPEEFYAGWLAFAKKKYC